MKAVRAALLVGGLVVLAALVARVGVQSVMSVLNRLAWWQLVLVCIPYGLIMAVDTLGWRYAFIAKPPPYLRMLAARTAGEAVNIVTALGSVGGEAVKVWLLRPAVSYDESVPSVVIAKTTSTIAQALLLLLGLVLAVTTITVDGDVIWAMLGLLGVELLLVGGFVFTQVAGLVRRAGRLLAWSGLIEDASAAEELDARLRRYYRENWRRFLLSVSFHFCGWLLGALEALVMLYVLEIRVPVATATVIEALGSGVRFATFLVPGSLGVLEGANTGVFGALGLGASAGLAFSLVRRARQGVWIAIGLVVLVAARLRATSATTAARRAA
ncbi:MAG TPA: flippase-like domain-containing protein [Candidatus Eisenbacteria bacterium]|nr:flippase-like domain-containing protein [Candidatus Eisenbacteria bacterium]